MKPVMKNAPKWARWVATDNDGASHWFECRPRYNRKLGVWTAKGHSEITNDG